MLELSSFQLETTSSAAPGRGHGAEHQPRSHGPLREPGRVRRGQAPRARPPRHRGDLQPRRPARGAPRRRSAPEDRVQHARAHPEERTWHVEGAGRCRDWLVRQVSPLMSGRGTAVPLAGGTTSPTCSRRSRSATPIGLRGPRHGLGAARHSSGCLTGARRSPCHGVRWVNDSKGTNVGRGGGGDRGHRRAGTAGADRRRCWARDADFAPLREAGGATRAVRGADRARRRPRLARGLRWRCTEVRPRTGPSRTAVDVARRARPGRRLRPVLPRLRELRHVHGLRGPRATRFGGWCAGGLAR